MKYAGTIAHFQTKIRSMVQWGWAGAMEAAP
jgi:hypothetical protein